MGKRGPAATPSALNKLRGNPGKRRARTNEPKPPEAKGAALVCPDELQGFARDEWNRIIDGLKGAGVYTEFDQFALILYCDIRGMYRQLCLDMAGMPIQKSKRGAGRMSAAFLAKVKLIEKAKAILAEFGFTPASRTRIETALPTDQKKTKMEEWKQLKREYGGK